MKNIIKGLALLILLGVSNHVAGSDSIVVCRTMSDLQKNDGQWVKAVGVYRFADAGMCCVSDLLLADGSIVIGYQPKKQEVQAFDNKVVSVTGRVLMHPEKELSGQFLMKPHMVDVVSIECPKK